MTAPDILINVGRGWNREPASVALGTNRTGVSAALWKFDETAVFEVCGDASPDVHIVSLPVGGKHRLSYSGDGRTRFSKPIHPWHANVVLAGEKPHAVLEPAASIAYLHLYLPTSVVEDCVAAESGIAPEKVELIDPCSVADPVIGKIGQNILAEMRHNELLSRLRVDVLSQELTIQLLRQHSNLAGTTSFARGHHIGGLAPGQLRRVIDRMLSALDEDVSLADLARVAGLSSAHFCTAFRQSTGVPPHRWLLERRIERAKELLVDPRLSLTEIALEVGYSGQGAFGAAFRRLTGVTPSGWRREQLL